MSAEQVIADQERLEKIRLALVARLSEGLFTRFPGNPRKAVAGVRWNVSGSKSFLLLYWAPTSETFDPQEYQTASIWCRSTEISAWERHLDIVPPETVLVALKELAEVPGYFERKQTWRDAEFLSIAGKARRGE